MLIHVNNLMKTRMQVRQNDKKYSKEEQVARAQDDRTHEAHNRFEEVDFSGKLNCLAMRV